jgi:hypothetical protein
MRFISVCINLVNIDISNEISSFAHDTSGLMSNDSFLDMALLTKQPVKSELWAKITKEKVFSKHILIYEFVTFYRF